MQLKLHFLITQPKPFQREGSNEHPKQILNQIDKKLIDKKIFTFLRTDLDLPFLQATSYTNTYWIIWDRRKWGFLTSVVALVVL